MALRLVTADERLAENKTTAVVLGRSKIGKTSLLWTMPPNTLFLNLESGMKSVQGWPGLSLNIGCYQDAADIACLIGGVDPAAPSIVPEKYTETKTPQESLALLHKDLDTFAYTQAHHEAVCAVYGEAIDLSAIRNLFWDSISDLTRLGMTWAKSQPAAFSEKTGKPDTRGAYGLLGRSVIRMLRHVQHTPGKNVIFVGGLDCHVDEFNRETWKMQAEGGATSAQLPFIVDQIITMSDFDYDAETKTYTHNFGKGQYRAFCCAAPNPWGLPAGDRSGNLDLIEEPHLGKLIEKASRPQLPPAERLHYSISPAAA